MLPDLYRLIASDRYLAPDEIERASEPHPATASAWEVYVSQFQGFTGATLDPDGCRLSHPATHMGRVRVEPGTTVVVAGTDASLLPAIHTVRDVRQRLRIFTSPRGAEVLQAHGIIADVVLVEYQTPAAARQAMARRTRLPESLVAADWKTPAALIADVPDDRLFVPAPALTWGLWQATAVAMAIEAGAARIALLGVDLEHPTEGPLKALLELLARLAPFTALDCSTGPAQKRGWVRAAVKEVAGIKLTGRIGMNLWSAPSVGERMQQAQQELVELAPVLHRAERLLSLADEAREMGNLASSLALEAGIDEVMEWRRHPRTRLLVQETLGASFLPRLWRVGVDPSAGRALRRPLLLATHELTRRADALAEVIAARRAA